MIITVSIWDIMFFAFLFIYFILIVLGIWLGKH